jgi:DNA helicase-2/ATP-dependent DNA helicase PcrA
MSIAPALLRVYPTLSEAQRTIVSHSKGPLLIIAGPGSGKTFSLVLRAMNLLVLGQAVPRELVLCTFTEKAALELRDRMAGAALSERHPQRAVGNRTTHEIHGGT